MLKSRHFHTVAAIIVFIGGLTTANVYADNVMTLDRQTVIECALRIQKAIEDITPREEQLSKVNRSYHAVLVKRMVVDPIVNTGFDYEKSVLQIAKGVMALQADVKAGRITGNQEYNGALAFIFRSVYSSSDHLLAYGYISGSTRVALEKVIKAQQNK